MTVHDFAGSTILSHTQLQNCWFVPQNWVKGGERPQNATKPSAGSKSRTQVKTSKFLLFKKNLFFSMLALKTEIPNMSEVLFIFAETEIPGQKS